MKQRTELARVLINELGVVLKDEPFRALDDLARVGIQDLVRALGQNQKYGYIGDP